MPQQHLGRVRIGLCQEIVKDDRLVSGSSLTNRDSDGILILIYAAGENERIMTTAEGMGMVLRAGAMPVLPWLARSLLHRLAWLLVFFLADRLCPNLAHLRLAG